MAQCNLCVHFDGMWCYCEEGTKFGRLVENQLEEIICNYYTKKISDNPSDKHAKNKDLIMYLENTL